MIQVTASIKARQFMQDWHKIQSKPGFVFIENTCQTLDEESAPKYKISQLAN